MAVVVVLLLLVLLSALDEDAWPDPGRPAPRPRRCETKPCSSPRPRASVHVLAGGAPRFVATPPLPRP